MPSFDKSSVYLAAPVSYESVELRFLFNDFPPTTLCSLPYLVSSAYPQGACELAGLIEGGSIDIDVHLEMVDYYSNLLPMEHPPYQYNHNPDTNLIQMDSDRLLNNTYIVVVNYMQWMEYTIGKRDDHIWSLSTNHTNHWNSHLHCYRRYPLTGGSFHRRVTVDRLDRYTVLLVNSDNNPLRITGTIRYMNPAPYHHLSAEQAHVSWSVLVLCFLYIVTSLLAVAMLWLSPNRKAIHLVMVVSWLFSIACLALDATNCFLFSQSGELPVMLWAAPRVIRKIQEIIGLMVFFFVSLGWKILRSQLSRLEVQFAAGISVTSLAMGITEIYFDRMQYWRFLLHAMVLFCTSIAISFNITLLQSHLSEAGISLGTSNTYRKVDSFRALWMLFWVYLMKELFAINRLFKFVALYPIYENISLTNTVQAGDKWGLSWDEWIFVLVDGLLEYFIFVGIFWYFRPRPPIRLFKDVLGDRQELADSEEGNLADSEEVL